MTDEELERLVELARDVWRHRFGTDHRHAAEVMFRRNVGPMEVLKIATELRAYRTVTADQPYLRDRARRAMEKV